MQADSDLSLERWGGSFPHAESALAGIQFSAGCLIINCAIDDRKRFRVVSLLHDLPGVLRMNKYIAEL
jgi:hypothetical protein